MIARIKQVFYLIGIIFFTFSCGDGSEEEGCANFSDLSGIDLNVEFQSLEDEFLTIKNADELKVFFERHPVIHQHFLNPQEFPDSATFYAQTLARLKNPHLDTLLNEVKRVFGDGEKLKNEFKEAFRHLKYYYPDIELPKIKTIATGLVQDMYISDTLIIVGLDYYLGEGAKYRPLDMYAYMLERYEPEYIVPSAMLIYGISPRFNKTNLSDNTIIADMITYGKAFQFAKYMMPCTPDSILIWYNTEEIKGVRANEAIIWAHFVENELMFETSHELKRKYIEERPKTYEIGNAAPGRIGTWLGWEIVREYMARTDIILQELMQEPDARKIFRESRYKP